ncbi:hypothetical protein A7A08_01091 [Methyloligella halotolerans]|uniref:Uncharacterized protein n=1 Tax=Methyloligella halotolerans TaxID=1177755 RepID=A0A1E2S0A1_9HYPH|nr:hypothetical protein [Methyloligella halotolerans]ODA67923.1 hypothetical protein A7A08_01091 [Methyloligella halotolerans]
MERTVGTRPGLGAFAAAAALGVTLGLCAGAADAADTSLREAVLAQSGKYLEAPDVEGETKGVSIEAGSIDEPTQPVSISMGDVSAEVSYQETQPGEDAAFTSKVTVLSGGEKVAELDVDEFNTRFPYTVQIVEIDPANDTPEVVVSTYSGGAHCCGVPRVATKSADADTWSVVDLGEFDGEPPIAKDYNGNGRSEFIVDDAAFLYTFGAYAFSVAPQVVLTVEGGEVKNVSADPAYEAVQKSWMKQLVDIARDDDVNAYLAGYVAQKSLLGEGDEAWTLMEQHYDKNDDWGLQTCDQPLTDAGVCPGEEVTLTYPEMLKRVLRENGYKIGG